MTYVSHARTPEELQAEVISDLQRRLDFLDGQTRLVPSRAEQSRLACAKIELEQMLRYWQELMIVRPKRTKRKIIGAGDREYPDTDTGYNLDQE